MPRVDRSRTGVFVLAGITVALVLAGFVSYHASANPDGLVSTAQEVGFGKTAAEEHAVGDSTFAGYTTEGVANGRLSGAIAGVVGVLITLAAGSLLFVAVRRRNPSAGGTNG